MSAKVLRYRSKPKEIEAVQWKGDNYAALLGFIPGQMITTREGSVHVYNALEAQWLNTPLNHFVIKGLKGEFYPCEPEVFHSSYELVQGQVAGNDQQVRITRAEGFATKE